MTRIRDLAASCFMLLIIALPWSIAPMSIAAVTCGALTLAAMLLPPGGRWQATPVDRPALAWSLSLGLSAVFGLDPGASFPRLGKALFPILVPLAAFHGSNRRRGERAMALLLISSAAASVFGVVLFWAKGASFAARARGPTGHYMTFGGQLLLTTSLAAGVALVARDRRWRLASAGTAALGAAALACTYTRSAWLGLAASLMAMVAAARPRWFPVLAAALVAIYILVPGDFRTRLHSAFDPGHPNNRERTLMWEAGARMFRERPLTGVGLQDLRALYPRYRSPAAREIPGHLHSDWVQIAASMGIVGLAAFAALYGSLLVAAGSGLRAMIPRSDLAAGLRLGVLAALVGFLVAGLFEWNFGDEELLYLLYVMVGLAWSARHWDIGPVAGEDRNAA